MLCSVDISGGLFFPEKRRKKSGSMGEGFGDGRRVEERKLQLGCIKDKKNKLLKNSQKKVPDIKHYPVPAGERCVIHITEGAGSSPHLHLSQDSEAFPPLRREQGSKQRRM